MPYPPHHEVRLLVCGGRDFADQGLFDARMAQVDALHWIKTVVRDGETGAGAMAGRWAFEKRRGLLTAVGQDQSEYLELPLAVWLVSNFKPDLILGFPGGEYVLPAAWQGGVTVWVA